MITTLLANQRLKLLQTIFMNKAHTEKQFDEFLSQLLDTNATLDFFCDFKKINRNVNEVSIKLNQLNYLIGQENMEAAIRELWHENKNVFSVLDILIAVRRKDKKSHLTEMEI